MNVGESQKYNHTFILVLLLLCMYVVFRCMCCIAWLDISITHISYLYTSTQPPLPIMSKRDLRHSRLAVWQFTLLAPVASLVRAFNNGIVNVDQLLNYCTALSMLVCMWGLHVLTRSLEPHLRNTCESNLEIQLIEILSLYVVAHIPVHTDRQSCVRKSINRLHVVTKLNFWNLKICVCRGTHTRPYRLCILHMFF